MDNIEIQQLKFRRQYIIAPAIIDCPFLHTTIPITEYYQIYAHTDLVTAEYSENGIRIILLGDMFDFESPLKRNSDILKDLICEDFTKFVESTFRYCGRFLIIFIENGTFRLVHDASAARKVYYCDVNGKPWFASQPFLLAKLLRLNPSQNISKQAFYQSVDFHRLNNSNIGDTTRYDEIRQLIPNHYFDVRSATPVRYYPNERINYITVSEAAEKCALMIKGYMESISNRYNIMVPVTAGKDSRILLAATRDITEKVFYYINRDPELSEKSNDIAIPKRLLSKLNLDFHVIDLIFDVDESFRKIYLENNPYATLKYLPHFYNYYKNFNDKVNLPGNNASAAFEIFKYKDMKISAINLAKLYKVEAYDYAVRYYDDWVSELRESCINNRICPISLFYWEERQANWGTQLQMEKDIAQDEFNPFNSRQLIELFLSVETRNIEMPRFILHHKIIQLLWPELLKFPINPGWKNTFRKFLSYIGVHGMLIKYRFIVLNFISAYRKRHRIR